MKKKVLIFIFIIVILCAMIVQRLVTATITEEKYLAVLSHRTVDDETIGYGINTPGWGGKVIGTIQEYTDNKSIENVKPEQSALYCLKADMGFLRTR